ncbi:hypothetical protein AVEN_141634-1 [Araneus ventricosus]|uniref:Uncharacterized protein n=1 Tax=Araneus ventricosus TaxID=182803 RepID=A0A4Y2U6Y7_ARAVE|nr:hypothetical protein AVEN_141634-1 [Araneus ventricosus]
MIRKCNLFSGDWTRLCILKDNDNSQNFYLNLKPYNSVFRPVDGGNSISARIGLISENFKINFYTDSLSSISPCRALGSRSTFVNKAKTDLLKPKNRQSLLGESYRHNSSRE